MIESWWGLALAMAASYLLGSVPTGFLYGRLRGQDIRTLGSGNLGATNIHRIYGPMAGAAILLLDACKGFIAVFWISRLAAWPTSDWAKVGCALSAILGHTYTCFLNFRGGKGVATSLGVFLGLAPAATLLVLLPFGAAVALTRYVSVGSLSAAVGLPLLLLATGETGGQNAVLWLAVLVSLVVVIRHRQNIRRLLQGTENRLGASGANKGETC
ncbi:MAG: glycerol-3-phosphate 1-O-acyltransferase PlsY [candidate division FCPU426 bacterium]